MHEPPSPGAGACSSGRSAPGRPSRATPVSTVISKGAPFFFRRPPLHSGRRVSHRQRALSSLLDESTISFSGWECWGLVCVQDTDRLVAGFCRLLYRDVLQTY